MKNKRPSSEQPFLSKMGGPIAARVILPTFFQNTWRMGGGGGEKKKKKTDPTKLNRGSRKRCSSPIRGEDIKKTSTVAATENSRAKEEGHVKKREQACAKKKEGKKPTKTFWTLKTLKKRLVLLEVSWGAPQIKNPRLTETLAGSQ